MVVLTNKRYKELIEENKRLRKKLEDAEWEYEVYRMIDSI